MSYDCQTCGACCVGLDVLLTDAEADAFERDPELVRLTTLYQPTASPAVRFMKRHPQTDRCLALEGPLERCRCRIYARRPMLCRALQAGSPDCEQARARTGQLHTGQPHATPDCR
ncbi:MAG: YkgJ family cysteine cluster protein [Planctomycetota bacterium]